MKNMPDIKIFKHIAIVQTAFIGDVALSLYLAQAIKNIHPKGQLTFVTTPVSSPLVACSCAVDNVISYDKRGLQSGRRGMRLISEALAERGVDCIISPHRSLRSALISRMAKPSYSVSFNKSSFSFLYDKRIKYSNKSHETERNLSLLKAFSGIEYPLGLPEVELEISDEDKGYVESRLNWAGITNDDPFAVIAPASAWETKMWKPDYFITLSEKLKAKGVKSVIIGSTAEKTICSRIATASGAIDLSGDTSLPQMLYLCSLASVTVTNDSSPTHIAGLAGCPAVTIFGPTSPVFGFGPTGSNDRTVYRNLKCSPCAIHGGRKCPKGTHECMKSITPDEVLFECSEIIRNREIIK